RVPAEHHLFGPLHRRSGAAAGDRRLPQARARLRGSRRSRACGLRAVPQRGGRRGIALAGGTLGINVDAAPPGLRHMIASHILRRPMAYDPNNIFAKILRGELPAYKVYEDDKALAFLDIMPRAPGHTLVLPKSPARNILDVDPDDLAHVAKVAQRIANAAVKA